MHSRSIDERRQQVEFKVETIREDEEEEKGENLLSSTRLRVEEEKANQSSIIDHSYTEE